MCHTVPAADEMPCRQGLKVGDKSMETHLKETAYKDEIAMFKQQLSDIGQGQGWTLDDRRRQFSNKLWDDIVYG